ncbi:MAG: hypothetical protein ACKOZT_04915 [Cyanobium sp.]
MTPAEAFAAIPLAAVCADHRLQSEEAQLLNSQLRGRSPYREMEPVAFATMVSALLLGLRDRRDALLVEAAALLSPEEQEQAYALAARLIHADRTATPEELSLLKQVGSALTLPAERLQEIAAACEPPLA